MTYDDYRDNLASCIRGVSCEFGDLVQALGYESKYSDLSLRHSQDGVKKLRAALDRIDMLNIRFAALGHDKTET
jgi:hypothetical protein